MKSCLLAVLTALCVSAVAAADVPGHDGEAVISLEGVPVQGTITADDTDWYRVEVDVSVEEQLVAIVDRGNLLICVFDESTGAERGALVTPEKPLILPLGEGGYRMSLRTTTTTVYELFRLPVPGPNGVSASASSADNNRAPQWPEREVPELVRSAEGVVGRTWGLDSRSYKLDVAADYRAELTVECRTGAFEAMAIKASGTIVSLLLPGHVENAVQLGAGTYHIFLIAHAEQSKYEITVKMSRRPTPRAR